MSGALKCGGCRGAIALVSGKASGYYGCLNASRRSCDNKVLIPRKRLEEKFLTALNEAVLKPEVLAAVYERTAKKIKEQFAHVPEELRLKKLELNRAETRVHNFIEFIASGRATPALADALSQAEEQVKALTADVASMESAKDHAFTPPPRTWIADRVAKLNELLATRTEASALALRRLTGPVTLAPEKPPVGRPYFRVKCRFSSLNLLVADGGSNVLQWWRRRESKGDGTVVVSMGYVKVRRMKRAIPRAWRRAAQGRARSRRVSLSFAAVVKEAGTERGPRRIRETTCPAPEPSGQRRSAWPTPTCAS